MSEQKKVLHAAVKAAIYRADLSDEYQERSFQRIMRGREAIPELHVDDMKRVVSAVMEAMTQDQEHHDVPCIHCDETGSVQMYEDSNPATRAITVDCQKCKGNGYTIEPVQLGNKS